MKDVFTFRIFLSCVWRERKTEKEREREREKRENKVETYTSNRPAARIRLLNMELFACPRCNDARYIQPVWKEVRKLIL